MHTFDGRLVCALKRSLIGSIAGLILGSALLGCAPGLKTVSVSKIPAIESDQANLGSVRVAVRPFQDFRADQSIGIYKGTKLQADGDIGRQIQLALEDGLKAKGARLSLFNVPSISGQVTDWYVQVTDEFPSPEVQARAALKLEVFDVNQHRIYSGSYSGTAALKHPLVSQTKVEDTLGLAMKQAILEALTDPDLVAKLGISAVR